VEKGISTDFMVQSVKCNLFDNKSILVRIYIPDSVDPRTLRYGNLEMLKSAILGHALAVDTDSLVEDMIVQICNSTTIHCTMRSARSLISMSLNDLVNRPGQLEVLVPKMLATMTPVIGSHLVGGKFVPVEKYGEYFNP
jgi:carbon starvation protein CstA